MVTPLTAEEQQLLGGLTTATREGQSPLRCFQGTITTIKPKQEPSSFDKSRMTLRLIHYFSDVKVCQAGSLCGDKTCVGAVVPFPWPIAELTFNHPGLDQEISSSSPAGVWANSITKAMGRPVKVLELVGKRIHVRWTEGHTLRRLDQATNKWGDTQDAAYEVVSIVGQQAANANNVAQLPMLDHLVSLADGKQEAQVTRAWLLDDRVKSGEENIMSQLTTAPTLVYKQLLDAGKLRLEGNVYHKV